MEGYGGIWEDIRGNSVGHDIYILHLRLHTLLATVL